jgi:predicted PhzF superfamily epimerase YddE/YHI9
MSVRIFQVDAFTDEVFRGNPAGVCLYTGRESDSWLQGVAAEMNLSETAFVLKDGERFKIRYFTPAMEVPLCGHATLSSAHILWKEGLISPGAAIRFSAQGGELRAIREGDWICLDFPTLPATEASAPKDLELALGAPFTWVGRLQDEGFLVEFESERIVRGLRPDFARILDGGFGSIIATARGAEGSYDFVSRFFAPGFGINEDPVTGVAHCTLCPYWAGRLGKRELLGHQVSKRGGVVRVRDRGERTDILGKAVTVMKGEVVI